MASSVSHSHNAPQPLAETSTSPTAGPLPRKRGELGFEEGSQDEAEAEGQASAASSTSPTLPARHPADRDQAASSEAVATPADPPRTPSRAESTSTTNTTSKRSLISFLKPKRIPTVAGLRATTLVCFFVQLFAFGATLAGWVIVIQRMQKSMAASSDPSPPSPPPSSDVSGTDDGGETTTAIFNTTSAQIFVHVAFGIVALAQLIFIERRLFRLRAERYAYVHPGEILPSARRAQQEATMGLAPWNRPPLPTYAAALAHTLLLAGFLSEALRTQRPRSNGSSRMRGSRASAGSARSEEDGDRPKSYMSTDPEWEARCDADRALVLEETLARLEEGQPRSRSS
ncbi:hypothetical protein C8Q80DRAFT_1216930 [Daedaleopsis nitida]|nr:hypothetical protein C8Q80DRAFT_1216930 [Daedaleopsis nitida]